MRAVLIVDRDFTHRELPHVRTLLLGLVDTGVRPMVAFPEDMLHEHEDLPGVRAIGYRDRGAFWTIGIRARELSDQIPAEDKQTTIVHALGSRAPDLAAQVAIQLGAPLVIDVHERAAVAKASSIAKERESMCLVLAPTAPLARAIIADGVAPARVREIPWGVMKPDSLRHSSAAEATGIVIAGSGQDRNAWETLVRALAQIASRREDFLVLADADATERANISRLVASLGLSPLYSRIPRLEVDRSVILRADILLLPDADGVHRSLVLDALASGMAIVAAEDRDIPMLSDPTISRLCSCETGEWVAGIEPLIEDASTRQSLGDSARGYIAEHHRLSRAIAGVVDAYEWMVGSDAIPMSDRVS